MVLRPSCNQDSLLPLWFSITYGIINCFLIIALLVYVYRSSELNQYETRSKRLWSTIKSVKSKRSCYFPLITHVFDQATDIGVIVEFYQLWQSEIKYGNDICIDVNGLYLFVLSIGCLFLYRIVSSLLVLYRTKSIARGVLQFFDVLLFDTIYINYKHDSSEPSNPQKWLQFLEATFEAFPQSLIQLFFVFKTSNYNDTVILSLIFSMFSLMNKIITDDKPAFTQEKGKYPNIKLSLKSFQKWTINKYYVIRVTFRIFDVLYRLLLLSLFWIFLGGFSLFVILFVEIIVHLVAGFIYNELSVHIVMECVLYMFYIVSFMFFLFVLFDDT